MFNGRDEIGVEYGDPIDEKWVQRIEATTQLRDSRHPALFVKRGLSDPYRKFPGSMKAEVAMRCRPGRLGGDAHGRRVPHPSYCAQIVRSWEVALSKVASSRPSNI